MNFNEATIVVSAAAVIAALIALLTPKIRVPVAILCVILVAVGVVSVFVEKPSDVSPVPPTGPVGVPARTSSGPASSPAVSGPSASYTTADPFPLCDPGGARWLLVGIAPKGPGACSPGNTPIAVPPGSYGFATVGGFPKIPVLSATSTVTIVGRLAGPATYHQRCLGVALGTADTGYFGYICNGGDWHVNQVANLGQAGVSVGGQVANGQFSFGADQPYSVALSLRGTSLTLTVALAASSNSPLTSDVTISPITPTVVGFGYGASDGVIPIDPSGLYGRVGQFSYRADT